MAFILFGALTLIFSSQISRFGLGHNQDPGPTAFPIALAIFLIGGGLVELGQWFRSRPTPSPGTTPVRAEDRIVADQSVPFWLAHPIVRLSLLLLLLISYIASLGWGGFTLSTLILAPLMMILLGTKTSIALLNSMVLVFLVKGLFGWALKVPLPAGQLGFPF